MSKQAMNLALEALITASGHVNNEAFVKVMMARDALVQALAEQPQREPLGFMNAGNILEMQQKSLPYAYVYPVKSTGVSVAVYTAPPAQPQQEPVAIADGTFNHNCPIGTPLYTSPPAQRTWVGLTDEQNRELFAAFVKKNLGDIAVMDGGRYISPKINNYWLVWQEAYGIKE